MTKIRKAVIPAAGFGTRFLPATKAIPKEMLPIVDTPTLQYVVEEAVKSGITEILIILGKNKKCIEDHFDISVELEQLLIRTKKDEYLKQVRDISNMAHIYYVRQKEMNGSGMAVLEAEAFVGNEPFAVLYGDDIIYNPQKPCLKQLIEAYDKTGKIILGCQDVPKEEASKYGIVNPGATKGKYTEVVRLVEKPKITELPSTLASIGRYILTPDIFDILKNTPPMANGEVCLTDAIQTIADSTGAYAYTFDGRRYDVGDKLGYIQATVEYGLRDEKLKDGLTQYLKSLQL
ncbi:MAG: UTP--glucose-1-phosphate uridylyltransferase GalU [Clostridia bacterium]|nr:UTP--glucose-1-phosphate uridylyltransferase GalU [Clostridia bacterium]